MAPTIYTEVSIMMKRYRIGDNCYWYEEGTQPADAVLADKVKEDKEDKAKPSVEVKVVTEVKNKSKGVKAK